MKKNTPRSGTGQTGWEMPAGGSGGKGVPLTASSVFDFFGRRSTSDGNLESRKVGR
jgi:hypothetical protein